MDAGGTWIDHQTRLEEADLLGYARELGLSEPRVLAAINTKRHAAAITQDAELAEDLSASGTPSFFINGRLLVGAQPVDSFKKVIDAEIARAADLVKQGTPATKVYEKLQSTAQPGGVELVKKVVSAPPASSPSRGPSRAKVVIQMFSDFQCPFCSRVTSTLEELLKAYPTEVRLVWRNKPLPFHQNAERASEAALEALQQKGNDGFWAMYAILFANQAKLDRASLDGYAAQLGLDPTRFAYALDNHTHKPEIDADAKLADSVDISGTPTFLINGYLVSGAQPLSKFRRVVERALAEAK
jgi:protein-disulfide isomerase